MLRRDCQEPRAEAWRTTRIQVKGQGSHQGSVSRGAKASAEPELTSYWIPSWEPYTTGALLVCFTQGVYHFIMNYRSIILSSEGQGK